MTTTDNKTKAKRQMSEEQLEKLKYAREKAIEKRRELAEIRKMERDLQLKEKENKVKTIKAKHSKMNSKAVTKAEPESESESEPESDSSEILEPVFQKKIKKKKKKKKPIVIVEDSDSSDSDSNDDSNVVYVKRRSKSKTKYEPTSSEPIQQEIVQPLRFYGQGFSRQF